MQPCLPWLRQGDVFEDVHWLTVTGDEADDFVPSNFEGDVVERYDIFEGLREVLDLEYWSAHLMTRTLLRSDQPLAMTATTMTRP